MHGPATLAHHEVLLTDIGAEQAAATQVCRGLNSGCPVWESLKAALILAVM